MGGRGMAAARAKIAKMKNIKNYKNVGSKNLRRRPRGMGDDSWEDIRALERFERDVERRRAAGEFDDYRLGTEYNFKIDLANISPQNLFRKIGQMLKGTGMKGATRGGITEIASAIVDGRSPSLTLRNGAVHHEGGSTATYEVV